MQSKKNKKKKKSKHTKKLVSLTPEQKDRKRKRKASAKRKKELAKLLSKKSREHGANPYSAVRYHNGYVFDPTRYTVLTASNMSKEWKAQVTSVMKTVTSGPEAMTLPEKPGWACIVADRNAGNGRVLIVSYSGTEVALFFKRQLTTIIPEPGDKTPEGVMQDPREAWQRLDLLGHSAEQSNFVLAQTHRRLEEANRLLTSRVGDLDDLNDTLTLKVAQANLTIAVLKSDKGDLEKSLRLAQRSARVNPSPSKPTPKLKTSLKKAGKRGTHVSKTRSKRRMTKFRRMAK
jgi:hypothetical protein